MLLAAELVLVRIPLVRAFRTATTITDAKDALLVRVETDDGAGWGECVASNFPGYLADTIDSSRAALRDHFLPRAFAGRPFDDIVGNHPARAALECALLDAQLRAQGVSLASHLGATASHVDAGVAVGFDDDVDTFLAAGYRRLKCKIEPGRDTTVLRAARAVAGPEVKLAADANGTYTIFDMKELVALDEFDLQCIEQPLPTDALRDHATLAAKCSTPLCLDESITSAAVARDAIALGACRMVSVKPGRLGGLGAARLVHDACVGARVPALAGGMLETGIGRAALLALAALPGFAEPGDCSASERYFGPDGDLTEPFVLDDGRLRVPDGPGLGVDVRPDRLTACTIARERLTKRDA
jgi:O-succinylbenzoate synthase